MKIFETSFGARKSPHPITSQTDFQMYPITHPCYSDIPKFEVKSSLSLLLKSAPNISCGFDQAVLTHKRIDEAFVAGTLSYSELGKNERLFLISNHDSDKYKTLNDKDIARCSSKLKRTVNRKRVIFDDTFTYAGKNYQVNSNKSGLYVGILKPMIEQFERAVIKWRRVFVLRFDLHMHINRPDNKEMTAYRKRLFSKLKRVYGFKHIGFCWVREQERAKSQHYHWVLFLDGDLIRRSHRINQMVKEAWERPDGNYTMPVIPSPFYFADSEEIKQKVIYRVSYLAKPRGKGYRPKQTKDYQCSRMRM